MEEEEFETTNIHTKWLESIYEQIRNIQAMQRIAKEGALTLMDYLQIPMEMHPFIIPETEYKNLRFMVLEMDMLVSNLANVLKDKTKAYHEDIKKVTDLIDNRNLFIKDKFQNGQLVSREVLLFFKTTINYLFAINAEIINDIPDLLWIKEEESGKKKW